MHTAQTVVPLSDRDHIAGRPTAPVILIEYGDFESSACARAHPIVQAAQRELGDILCFVYRHFPLTARHPHAQLAAEAAEAAGAQGRFWPMHDILFRHQNALELDDLLDYAERAGANPIRVAGELAAGTHTQKVLDDARGGLRSGVHDTPTFFVNGTRYEGVWADQASFVGMLARAAMLAHEVSHH
jgi:protein-disulfide isomerase